jgi:hypothetical protein
MHISSQGGLFRRRCQAARDQQVVAPKHPAGGTMKARLIRLTTLVASLAALAAVLGAGQKWR